MSDRDLEAIISNVRFSDSAHKNQLKKRLFETSAELSLDDLIKVTGGAAGILDHNQEEKWDPWPTAPNEHNLSKLK